jgi:hypothetical protein
VKDEMSKKIDYYIKLEQKRNTGLKLGPPTPNFSDRFFTSWVASTFPLEIKLGPLLARAESNCFCREPLRQ